MYVDWYVADALKIATIVSSERTAFSWKPATYWNSLSEAILHLLHCMNKDEGDSSTSNHLAPIQQQKVSSTPNLRKHRMSDTHWDVNGDGKRAILNMRT